MILFGKSRAHMEVMAAEFLPHDKQLYLMVADADCNLHVLQYDPERKPFPPPSHPPPPPLTPSAPQTRNPSPANASSTRAPSTQATSPPP